MPRGLIVRSAVYSIVGFTTEIVFSALHDVVRGDKVMMRTSPWMVPIYALIGPLYEPLHKKLRDVPAPVRGSIYGLGFMGVEYATGRALRSLRGEAPWDYTYATRHIDGLVRPDYFPFWAAGGLALERLHDRLSDDPLGRAGAT